MKALIYTLIFTGWFLILGHQAFPSDTLNLSAILYFQTILIVAALTILTGWFYSTFFVIHDRTYWIKKGKHYAAGKWFDWMPNVKLFFFKREIEFEYMIDERALQDDKWQLNKIYGFSTIIPRLNSLRWTFSNDMVGNQFSVYDYIYYRNKRTVSAPCLSEANKWEKIKLTSPRLIWFGYIHNPYHGGKIPSSRNYFIKIRNVRLK